MELVGRVQAFADRHALWTSNTAVVAAVSGGADSVALLLLLHELAQRGHLRLAGVAHLHHHIRDREADEDAAFVAALTARLGIPLDVGHADVPTLARRAGESLQLAARHARLAYFDTIARRADGPLVALAHTRSDQAETVVLRLVRGAGPRGLAGMAPRTGHRIRPLLEIGRGTLRAWLIAQGETWREDSSNQDSALARNRVRQIILPELARLNPAAEEALARAAQIHAADARLLEALARREAARLLSQEGATVRLDLDGIRRLPVALARRVVRLAFAAAGLGEAPSWRQTEAVLGARRGCRDIGAARLELFGGSAVLSSKGGRTDPGPVDAHPAVALPLEVPGSIRHPSGWWEVEASAPAAVPAHLHPPEISARQVPGGPSGTEGARAVLDAAALGRHLTIRGWLPGDRVQPLGLGGRRKLQDVFVDRKVPRDERARVPIVVDAHGRIAWVAGYVIGEAFRVTPHSDAVVVLTLRR